MYSGQISFLRLYKFFGVPHILVSLTLQRLHVRNSSMSIFSFFILVGVLSIIHCQTVLIICLQKTNTLKI